VRPRRRVLLAAALAAVTGALGAPVATAQPVPAVVPPARLQIPLFSPRRVPDLVLGPIADERLRAAVAPVIGESPPEACLTVSVAGRPVVGHNGDLPLQPASVNKLLTAAAMLAHAAPDEPVATVAMAGGEPAGGVIEGPLWLVGGGDGLLTTDGYKLSLHDQQQTIVPFAELADNIRARGVTEIRGDIVADESRYDAAREVPSWPGRYLATEVVGPLGALLVNDGSTGYERAPERPAQNRKPGDPGVLAATTLRSLLEQRGVTVTGGVSAGIAPTGAREVARLQSTIADQVGEMLAWSDNTTAELLTKELGRRASGAGTTAAGTAATAGFLRDGGYPTAGLALADGSGLDPADRLTCDLLSAVLDRAGPTSTIAKALPVAGKKGTLVRRMRRTVGEGNVFAKTGTLGNVASLAGFERTGRGAIVTFAFVQNGPRINTFLQDRLAEALFSYPDAPDIADLVPPGRPIS
jgi:D-alanyl-D-alanine carboxypeptidase/D-alanyl-D-alanine-endopeptidase (penicillin-binding protein 4)